jgi:hypothetical protein
MYDNEYPGTPDPAKVGCYGDLTWPPRPTLLVNVGHDDTITYDYWATGANPGERYPAENCGMGDRWGTSGHGWRLLRYIRGALTPPTPGKHFDFS